MNRLAKIKRTARIVLNTHFQRASTMDKLSREERRKQKDLDEARKLGTAPAEVDEEGKYVGK